MTEQTSQPYCEVCGIDVQADTNLKRFGKFFCSTDHIEQYVRAKQSELGLNEERRERRRIRFGC
jgi:hypothetical protein